MITTIVEKLIRGERLSVEEEKKLLEWFARQEQKPTQDIVAQTVVDTLLSRLDVTDLSKIANQIGLQIAGEFRTGNGQTPGDGFTGGRFGYPGFEYDGVTYFLVGVEDDALQVGLSLANGKMVAGGGGISLDADGMVFRNETGVITFLDVTNLLEATHIFSEGTNDLAFQSNIPKSGFRFYLTTTDDGGPYFDWLEGATDNLVEFNILPGSAGGVFNAFGKLSVGPTSFSLFAGELIYDAGTEHRLEIGADHFFPTRDSSNPNGFWNEANQDMDFTIEGVGGINLKSDAGLNAVGVGGAPESGYALKVNGKAKVTGNVDIPDVNIRSRQVTINDDDAISFTPGQTIGGMAIFVATGTGNGGLIAYNAISGSAFAVSTGANCNVASGALTGTTGTDTKMTVSAHTDGKIYVENRLGSQRNFTILLM